MGVSCAWLAVKGMSAESLRADLGLHVAAEAEQGFEDDIHEVTLPDGWHLFESKIWEERLIDDSVAERLSRQSELVICCIEEHVMCSMTAGWKYGQRTWSINHNPDHGVNHLETSGKLPDCFHAIAEEHRTSQREDNEDEADYIFDIPIDVAAAITDYRYDADENDHRESKVVVFNKAPSFWKRLFG